MCIRDRSMNGESCNSADKVADILEKYRNITFLMGHSIQDVYKRQYPWAADLAGISGYAI